MQLTDIKYNDCVNGNGIVVSLWTQGCPHRCNGCHNPETWGFEMCLGYPYTQEIEDKIIEKLNANNCIRNLSILGGEPLIDRNLKDLVQLISRVREMPEQREIIIWTGYTLEELNLLNKDLLYIIMNIDYLIDGKFDINARDITLKWRGSPNQRILDKDILRKHCYSCLYGEFKEENYQAFLRQNDFV